MNIVVTKKFAKDVDKELSEQQKQQLAQILIVITVSKSLIAIPKLNNYFNCEIQKSQNQQYCK